MDKSITVPNILSAISDRKYSERDLLRTLKDIQSFDEDLYIECFLQFILDCAEVPLHITIDMHYSEAISRCTLNDTSTDRFLVYKDPARAHSISGFLQAFLSSKEEYRWTEKFTASVAELIDAMLEAEINPRITSCALFFLVGILFECTCIRSNCRMNKESSVLVDFCRKLLGLYDYDLLTDDNYLDIGLKLNYLFLFNADMFVDGEMDNVKHLTALLLIDNNQLKGELLKTFETVLESSSTTYCVKQGIISELVVLRDVIIAFCHFCPSAVALTALKLLKSNSQQLLPDIESKDKIYLLMINANKKVRESAKAYFLETFNDYLPREEGVENSNDVLLEVLDKFVGKYEDAVNNLPEILQLLLEDYFPNLMELFLYIVQTKSKIASGISTIIVKMMIGKWEQSHEASELLTDFMRICRGVVQNMSLFEDKYLYSELIRNIGRIPSAILKNISAEDAKEIRQNIHTHLMDGGIKYEDRKWMAGLIVKLIVVKEVPEDLIEMLLYQMDNWEGLAVCLEATLSSMDFKSLSFGDMDFKKLLSIATEELNNERDDKPHIVHVKQMCIGILADQGLISGSQVSKEVVSLLRFIEREYFGSNIVTATVQWRMLRAMTGLILTSIPFYTDASEDQRRYLNTGINPFDLWVTKLPDSWDCYKIILDFIEFSPNALNFEISKLWIVFLKSTNYRKFIPEFTTSLFQNQHFDSEMKRKFFIETTAKTIHSLNCTEPPISWTIGAAQAFQRIILAEISNNLDFVTHGSWIITSVLIRVFDQFEEFLLEGNSTVKKTDHRLRALDAFCGNLFKNFNLTQRDQTNITKSILKVMKLTPTDAEVKCLRNIVSALG